MNRSRPNEESVSRRHGPTAARFLESIHRTVPHALRTPLGTIVNYAAMLEAVSGSDLRDVGTWGARIRANAERLAVMIDLVERAVGLASRPLRTSSTDLRELVRRSMASSADVEVRISSRDDLPSLSIDVELVGFALRSFFQAVSVLRERPIDSVEVEVQATDEITLQVTSADVPPAGSPTAARADSRESSEHDVGTSRLETSIEVSLARSLITSHGGEMELSGHPEAHWGLLLRFPDR